MEWSDFCQGHARIHGLGIEHVAAAVRYIHMSSRKKLAVRFCGQFYTDPDVLSFDEMQKSAAKLFAFWGVLSLDCVLNLPSLLDNMMIESIWSKTDIGEELPGMMKFESAATSFGEVPHKLEELLTMYFQDLERQKKRKTGTEVSRREQQNTVKELEEKIRHFTERDPSTPWLLDMLDEAFGEAVHQEMAKNKRDYILALFHVVHSSKPKHSKRKRK